MILSAFQLYICNKKKHMNKRIKIGLIGMGLTLLITLLLSIFAGVSPALCAPFFMPWSVLILIGFTNKK
jgi:hypothetical protein